MNNIKVAYLLIAHKCPEQVNLFIRQLLEYGECNVYVHVDKKNFVMVDKLFRDDRVKVYSIYDVKWGSFEIVKAACYLMKMAAQSNTRYTHIYFGSGQDFLVKNGLYDYLESHPRNIFLKIQREITTSDLASARYCIQWPKKLMVRNDFHIYRFIRIMMQLLHKLGLTICANKKKLKNKVKFYEGRTWFVAPIEIMFYILVYLEDNPDYAKYWENSLASDLMFFQTIIMNSPYADNVRDELMYVNFGTTFGTKNHPLTITMDNVKEIENGDYYFARKFEWKEKETIQYFLQRIRR